MNIGFYLAQSAEKPDVRFLCLGSDRMAETGIEPELADFSVIDGKIQCNCQSESEEKRILDSVSVRLRVKKNSKQLCLLSLSLLLSLAHSL